MVGVLLATNLLDRKTRKGCSRIMDINENHDTHFLKLLVSVCEILSDFLITCRYVGADNVGVIKVKSYLQTRIHH